MQITIDTKELAKNKLMVCTPMYGGMCHGTYAKSALDLQMVCAQYGITCRFSFLFNESLITRARNYLVDEFLRSGFSHLLFLDADIHFNAQDVVAMLALDKDVIGAPYPKKSINWPNVVEAIRRNPGLNPKDLNEVVGDYVFNVVKGTEKFQVSEPLEVMEIGTGYMMVKKEVFPKMEAAYPQKRYKPDHIGQTHFDGSRYIHAYFDTVIDPASERYLSEDYMFCQWWRAIGGQVWLCPWMVTEHTGTFAFRGNMPKIAQLTGRL
jgi:hypothetical protein